LLAVAWFVNDEQLLTHFALDLTFSVYVYVFVLQIPSTAQSLDYNLGAMVFTSCLSDTSIAASVTGEDSYSAYLFGVTPWAPTESIRGSYTNWTAQEFSDRYETIYNAEPSYHAASAFAAGLCLVGAIEDTQSTDTAVLKEALESNFYNTFYANITFNSIHQAKFDMLLSQVSRHPLGFFSAIRSHTHLLRFDIITTSQPLRYEYLDACLGLTCIYVQILPSESAANVSSSWELEIVRPSAIASRTQVYPAPTWAQRSCVESTSYCDSHGQCDTSGVCQCDANYYGGVNPASCDTFCNGIIEENICREDKVLYIGGMVAYQYAEGSEYRSSMNLALELINNKTDGWFDDSTPQVARELLMCLDLSDLSLSLYLCVAICSCCCV
jgi:hypothetical protein